MKALPTSLLAPPKDTRVPPASRIRFLCDVINHLTQVNKSLSKVLQR